MNPASTIFAQTENLAQPGAGGDSVVLSIAFFFVGTLILIGGIALWKRSLSRPRPLVALDAKPSAIGFVDLFVVVMIWMGTQIVAGAVMASVGVPLDPSDAQSLVPLMFASGAAQLVGTAIAALLLLARYQSTISFGLRFDRAVIDLRLGVAAFLMVVPGVLLLQWMLSLLVPYDHPTLTSLLKNPSAITVTACWFAAVFSAPIAEEFFFRGILQNWLQRLSSKTIQQNQILFGGWSPTVNDRLLGEAHDAVVAAPAISSAEGSDNPYRAPASPSSLDPSPTMASGDSAVAPPIWPIFVSSAVFAAAHLGQGLAPVALFFFSLAIGYLYRQTSSLIPCIILHFLLNGFSMFWFTLNVLL